MSNAATSPTTEIINAPESRLTPAQVRVSMNRVILGWGFGAIFFQLSAGAIYASFARQLGASEAQFGFLAGIYPLMGFLQIPAARMLQGRVTTRQMMLTMGIFCRVLWVLAASLPWLHRLLPAFITREMLLPTFMFCVILSSVGQAFTGPSFLVWMSGLVPGRVGPTFWARRYQIGTLAGIGAVLLGGWLGDSAGWVKEVTGGNIPPLMFYSLILMAAAVCGVVDIAIFFGVSEVPDEEAKTGEELPSLWATIVEPLREPAVRSYLLFVTVAMIGFATTGPLLWIFCLETLEFSKTLTGFILTVCPLLGMAVSSKWWGQIAKIYGTRPMQRFSSLGLVLIPVAWTFALPTSVYSLAFVLFISGVLVASYEISNLNFITRAVPHLPRPMLTALFSICTGTTFALTAWGTGTLAGATKAISLDVAGINFVNYQLIFAVSVIPRLINAFVLAPRLQEPSSLAMRETVNQAGGTLAGAFGSRFGRFWQARQGNFG